MNFNSMLVVEEVCSLLRKVPSKRYEGNIKLELFQVTQRYVKISL